MTDLLNDKDDNISNTFNDEKVKLDVNNSFVEFPYVSKEKEFVSNLYKEIEPKQKDKSKKVAPVNISAIMAALIEIQSQFVEQSEFPTKFDILEKRINEINLRFEKYCSVKTFEHKFNQQDRMFSKKLEEFIEIYASKIDEMVANKLDQSDYHSDRNYFVKNKEFEDYKRKIQELHSIRLKEQDLKIASQLTDLDAEFKQSVRTEIKDIITEANQFLVTNETFHQLQNSIEDCSIFQNDKFRGELADIVHEKLRQYKLFNPRTSQSSEGSSEQADVVDPSHVEINQQSKASLNNYNSNTNTNQIGNNNQPKPKEISRVVDVSSKDKNAFLDNLKVSVVEGDEQEQQQNQNKDYTNMISRGNTTEELDQMSRNNSYIASVPNDSDSKDNSKVPVPQEIAKGLTKIPEEQHNKNSDSQLKYVNDSNENKVTPYTQSNPIKLVQVKSEEKDEKINIKHNSQKSMSKDPSNDIHPSQKSISKTNSLNEPSISNKGSKDLLTKVSGKESLNRIFNKSPSSQNTSKIDLSPSKNNLDSKNNLIGSNSKINFDKSRNSSFAKDKPEISATKRKLEKASKNSNDSNDEENEDFDETEKIKELLESVEKIEDYLQNMNLKIDEMENIVTTSSEEARQYVILGHELKTIYEQDIDSRKKLEFKINILDKLSKRLETDMGTYKSQNKAIEECVNQSEHQLHELTSEFKEFKGMKTKNSEQTGKALVQVRINLDQHLCEYQLLKKVVEQNQHNLRKDVDANRVNKDHIDKNFQHIIDTFSMQIKMLVQENEEIRKNLDLIKKPLIEQCSFLTSEYNNSCDDNNVILDKFNTVVNEMLIAQKKENSSSKINQRKQQTPTPGLKKNNKINFETLLPAIAHIPRPDNINKNINLNRLKRDITEPSSVSNNRRGFYVNKFDQLSNKKTE